MWSALGAGETGQDSLRDGGEGEDGCRLVAALPAGESRYGEASPSTSEQGGAFVPEPVAAAEMIGPVASPFHSERVRQKVAPARSRPRTLDEDARRM